MGTTLFVLTHLYKLTAYNIIKIKGCILNLKFLWRGLGISEQLVGEGKRGQLKDTYFSSLS